MTVGLWGDAGVGKTSLLTQYLKQTFESTYAPTEVIQCSQKCYQYNSDTKLKMRFYDTSGSATYHSITRNYHKHAHCALIVYDITSKRSFKNGKKWLEEARELSRRGLLVVLVGNKSDLSADREVSTEEALQFAEENEAKFIEVSSKGGFNVDAVFRQVAVEAPGVVATMSHKRKSSTKKERAAREAPAIIFEKRDPQAECGCTLFSLLDFLRVQ